MPSKPIPLHSHLSLEELERRCESFPSLEALQERCVYLQERPVVIRGVAGFRWIPSE